MAGEYLVGAFKGKNSLSTEAGCLRSYLEELAVMSFERVKFLKGRL